MNFDLTEDQQAFVQTARDFAAQELAPHAARWDAEHEFPLGVIRKAGELGFCGIYASEACGGLGLKRLDAALIFEQLSQGCTATTAYITIHNMCTWMVSTFGNDAQRAEFGGKLTAGEWLASYCLTEPGAGSDAAALKTSARRDGDDYVLNGSKMFISGAGSTEVLVVMARTADTGARGVTAFIVPAQLPGIGYGKNELKMGWRAQPTRAITFDNVRIPARYRLGAEGEGFKIAMKGLDGGRLNIASCSLGTAQAALSAAHRYLQERQQFGRKLGDFQALQFRLADMATELLAARLMVYHAASKLDAGAPDATATCAMAKRFATDICFSVCNEALQLHGGYGYLQDFPLERFVRDVRVHQILEGTNEIMRLIVARHLLSQPAL
ncbi:MAG: acyl-CoA dehydrogenase [Moraxellaceae bacterium]|jgi:alkylation response protein AidB-like acyl-CoA dehydrogenase|nr:acyl-CoA dehydrogenase [Moraxellaceae bacterium]